MMGCLGDDAEPQGVSESPSLVLVINDTKLLMLLYQVK
jgi:hypothetical protein